MFNFRVVCLSMQSVNVAEILNTILFFIFLGSSLASAVFKDCYSFNYVNKYVHITIIT